MTMALRAVPLLRDHGMLGAIGVNDRKSERNEMPPEPAAAALGPRSLYCSWRRAVVPGQSASFHERQKSKGDTAMKQEIGKALLVVFTEADPKVQEKSSEWFTAQHIPERMMVPGFLSARRFKLVEGNGVYKYLNIYELADESVLHGEGYAKSVATSTPPDYQPSHKSTRLVFRQVFPQTGAFEDKTGPHS
jgi:hypothetical protein